MKATAQAPGNMGSQGTSASHHRTSIGMRIFVNFPNHSPLGFGLRFWIVDSLLPLNYGTCKLLEPDRIRRYPWTEIGEPIVELSGVLLVKFSTA